MKKTNQEIANSLIQFAALLEATRDNPYRIRAYQRAADSLLKLDKPVELLITQGFDLTSLPWIGEKIASTIIHLINDEELFIKEDKKYKQVNELKDIYGLGRQKIKILNEQFQIYTKLDLFHAIQKDRLKQTKGFNNKLIEHLKQEIANPRKPTQFLRLFHALLVEESLLKHLKSIPNVQEAYSLGELRRKKEIIEKLDFIVLTNHFNEVAEAVKHFPFVKDVLKQTKEHLTLQLRVGIKLHLYHRSKSSKVTSQIFFTGTEEHLHHLQKIARQKKYDLRDQGLYQHTKKISLNTEKQLYEKLGLTYIEPELREDRGEIEAAQHKRLPRLIELQDIRGDLHAHTNETDGREPLENMVTAALEKGYHYLAITDHSKRLAITHGLDEKRLLLQIEKIDQLNQKLPKHFKVLKSIEVDILEDGSLDLSNEVLKELDLVVCSIHSKFHLPEEKQTNRILKAMENPYFNILGHATGRLIKSRPPYAIDIEKILLRAKENGCFIELNAQPYRLDIRDDYCLLAKKMGVKVAISSDAHSMRDFNYMQLGIYQARRGWLEKEDVINTYTWEELKILLKR